jgi:hypothetical protein
LAPLIRKQVRIKKCIVIKKNILEPSELKLRNSNTGRKKDCKKKKVISKKFKRVAYPRPEIYVTAPQGAQGPPGPQGIQGTQGPTGPSIIPHVISMLTANRYFYVANADIALPTIIPANQFTNDDGESVAEFTDFDQSGFANLFINGIMQVGSTYSVSTNALTIRHDQDTLFAGTPIILETVRFSVQITP